MKESSRSSEGVWEGDRITAPIWRSAEAFLKREWPVQEEEITGVDVVCGKSLKLILFSTNQELAGVGQSHFRLTRRNINCGQAAAEAEAERPLSAPS